MQNNFFVKGDDEIFKGETVSPDDTPFITQTFPLAITPPGSGSIDITFRNLSSFIEISIRGGFILTESVNVVLTIQIAPPNLRPFVPAIFLPVILDYGTERLRATFLIEQNGNIQFRKSQPFSPGVYSVSTPIMKFKI